MGKTFKHVDKGKYHNKILKYNDVCNSTKNMWDRHNSDISEDKQELFRIKNKIAEKELKQQIKSFELNKIFVESLSPIELNNIMKEYDSY